MGKEIVIESAGERLRPEKSEVERLWANNRKAKELLGWRPEYTLESGLQETIQWFSTTENLGFYRESHYVI
jgi:dTDP-glucose 4,6-dehydratase